MDNSEHSYKDKSENLYRDKVKDLEVTINSLEYYLEHANYNEIDHNQLFYDLFNKVKEIVRTGTMDSITEEELHGSIHGWAIDYMSEPERPVLLIEIISDSQILTSGGILDTSALIYTPELGRGMDDKGESLEES